MPSSTSTINTVLNCLKSQAFKSSKISRNSQRASAGSQILGSSIEFLTPAAMIPTKLAQTLLSGQTIFRAETNMPERLLHTFLCGISVAQLSLQSILLFQNDECQDTEQAICRGLLFLSLLYAGFLLTGWGSSEASKADSPINDNDSVHTALAPPSTTPPSLVTRIQGFFTSNAFESSKSSRKAQRASAGAQVLGSSFQFLTPAAVIPTKVSQVIFSGYALFNRQSTRLEKALNGTLCAVSFSELVLQTLLLFQNHLCQNNQNNICQAILFLGLIYSGILATGWISSEVSKGDTVMTNVQPITDNHADSDVEEVPEDNALFEMESPV